MPRVYQLRRKSGLLFTPIFLKQCRVALQRYYAGYYVKHEALSVPVSLTRSGLPRIIPKRLRWKIAQRDEYADRLVKLYMSWFGICKLIQLAPKVTRATFSSIVTPITDIDQLRTVLGDIKTMFSKLQRKYPPWISSIPLRKGMTWEPTWKSTPMTDRALSEKGPKGSPRTVILQKDEGELYRSTFKFL